MHDNHDYVSMLPLLRLPPGVTRGRAKQCLTVLKLVRQEFIECRQHAFICNSILRVCIDKQLPQDVIVMLRYVFEISMLHADARDLRVFYRYKFGISCSDDTLRILRVVWLTQAIEIFEDYLREK